MDDLDIESLVVKEGYVQPEAPFSGVTICMLRLAGGFVATGMSTNFGEDYDADEEKEMAKEDALFNLSKHLEFVLSSGLSVGGPSGDDEAVAVEEVDPIDQALTKFPAHMNLSHLADGKLH